MLDLFIGLKALLIARANLSHAQMAEAKIFEDFVQGIR
jgi:hypothetical protein